MANNSYLSFLGLLLGIQSWLYAEGQGRIIEKHVLIGQRVDLTCYLNSTEDATWWYDIRQNNFVNIYTCQNYRCQFTRRAEFIANIISRKSDQIEATRRNDTSILSLTPIGEEEHYLICRLGNVIMRTFRVKPIDPNKLALNCKVTLPRRDENGVGDMTLSCEVNLSELVVNLTMEGVGLNVPDDSAVSSQSNKAKTLYFDDSNNVRNASCNAYFPDIDITRSCIYPNIVKTQYIVEGNDIIVERDDESDVVYWRFYGSDGTEEDMEGRSWIREGGRFLLLRNVSERDVGKVVVCRTKGDDNQTNKGTIAFTVILKSSGDINNSNAHYAYFVLTLLFLTLWLITIAVYRVMYGCRSRSSHEVSTIPKTSDDERTQTTPKYAMVSISTSGENDLDTQRSSSGGLDLAGEELEGGKSSRKASETHYMDLSGNHGPTEYETIKSLNYENPRAENDVVPEESSQVDSGSAGGTAMAKGQFELEGSNAYYMDMSGYHGPAEYGTIKSLNYENPRAENDVVPEGSSQVDTGSAMEKVPVKLEGSKAYYMDMSGYHGPDEYETIKSLNYENPRAENDVVPEGSSQVDTGSAMEKVPVKLEGSKAYYMDMSGYHGPAEYETIKSLNYENPRADNDVVLEGSSQVDSGSAMEKGPVKLEGSKAYYMEMSGNHGRTDYEAMKSLTYANFYSM